MPCRFANGPSNFEAKVETMNGTSTHNVTLTAEISKDDVYDESDVTCLVQIPNTEYETHDKVTYDGMNNFRLISALKFKNSSDETLLQMSFLTPIKICPILNSARFFALTKNILQTWKSTHETNKRL